MVAVSRGHGYAEFTSGLRSELAVDLAEVEDPSASCGASTCEENPVYRVPWPSVGGDVAYCSYHLARYREQHPELWARVEEVVDEDITAFATQGDRFLTFENVPETLFGDEFRAIALLVTGHALFEELEPGKIVEYRTVDRRLEEQDSHTVQRGSAGEFLQDVEETIGVHNWAPDVEGALYGGEAGAE